MTIDPNAAAPPLAKGRGDFSDPFVWVIAMAVAAVHLALATRYDFFRNELYFIACGRRPDFGYADQPPLIPLLAAATQLFGPNLLLLRVPGALAAAALTPIAAALAFRLGGGRLAAITAGIAVAIAPGLIAVTTTLGTPTFEPLQWTLAAYLVVRATRDGERAALVWLGLLAGIAFAAKYGVAIWLVGLGLGALIGPQRGVIASREMALGLLLAVVIGAPSLIWQTLHGWPFLEIVRFHSAEGAFYNGSLAHFWIGQALKLDPLLAPLWLAGLTAPFAMRALRSARALSLGFLVTGAAVFAVHGKDYYLFPAYPTMMAVGAVAAARLSVWIVAPWLALASLSTAYISPLVLPLLDPPALRAFMLRTGLFPEPDEAAGVGAPIPQIFSDQLGWRELAAAVTAAYRALPDAERKDAAIFAPNYGEAAAIAFYGAAAGLPPVNSGDDQYFFWGPRPSNARTVIVVNFPNRVWLEHCGRLEQVATFGVPLAMPYERNRPISICHDLDGALAQFWPQLKRRRLTETLTP